MFPDFEFYLKHHRFGPMTPGELSPGVCQSCDRETLVSRVGCRECYEFRGSRPASNMDGPTKVKRFSVGDAIIVTPSFSEIYTSGDKGFTAADFPDARFFVANQKSILERLIDDPITEPYIVALFENKTATTSSFRVNYDQDSIVFSIRPPSMIDQIVGWASDGPIKGPFPRHPVFETALPKLLRALVPTAKRDDWNAAIYLASAINFNPSMKKKRQKLEAQLGDAFDLLPIAGSSQHQFLLAVT